MGVVKAHQDSTTVRSIQYVKGVGPRLAGLFSKLNLYTEEDLLFYVPETYQDRRQMPKIITFKCDMSVIFLGVVAFGLTCVACGPLPRAFKPEHKSLSNALHQLENIIL